MMQSAVRVAPPRAAARGRLLRRATPAALAALSLVLSLARYAPAQPTTVPVEADKPFVHAASGVAFPPEVGAFDRLEVTRFDAGGKNTAVGYIDRHARVVITVYVYPDSRGTLEAEFADVTRSLLQAHPGTRPGESGPWALAQGARTFKGLQAKFTLDGKSMGAEQPLLSQARLLPIKDHFVKYRVTYPSAKRDVAEKRIEAFIAALTLP